MAKELKCPNCGSPAAPIAGQANQYVCTGQGCGAKFTFEAGEARLTGAVDLDRLSADIEAVKTRQAEIDELLGKPEPPADLTDPPADPDEDDDEDDEDEEDE